MRIWSIHPKYLDAKGLVALWREALLAQKVLQGETNGYKNHPQLIRFRQTKNPIGAIAVYLRAVVEEATARGYNFDSSKISNKSFRSSIQVTSEQIKYEFKHLLNKLKIRDPKLYQKYKSVKAISLHPMFVEVDGDVEDWEIV